MSDEVEDLKQMVAAMEREYIGVQQMLGFVLLVLDRPVVVKKDFLNKGFPQNLEIEILDDQETDAFVFSIKEKSE